MMRRKIPILFQGSGHRFAQLSSERANSLRLSEECSSKVTTQFGKNPKLRLSSPEIRGYDSVRQKSKVTTRFGKNPKLRLGSPKI